MYIKRLHLKAFGKFINKIISFEDKFNIVFGENESGKSTIHSFIENVMYGFDGVSDHNRYKPWNSSFYKGSLEIGQGDNTYLISRNFLLDTVQVFKKVNGSNEENEDYELNDSLVENFDVPGEHFFNINRISFNNTVSISQLGNKTERELAGELKNKISNLSSTRDEDISIDRILRNLNSIKEEGGSEDDEKSLLGQYVLRLEELRKAKENTLISNRQVMFLAMEKKKLQSKIHQLNLKIQEKQKELSDYELSLEKQKVLKAKPYMEEIEKIKEELRLIEGYVAACSKEDYIEASETESSLASLKNERQRLLEEKDDCLIELKTNEEDLCNHIPSDFELDKLNEDYNLLRETQEKIDALKTRIESDKESIASIDLDEINKFISDYQEVEDLKSRIQINNALIDNMNYDSMKQFGMKHWWLSFLYGLLGFAFAGAGGYSCYYAYNNNIFTYYYGAVGFLIGIFFFVLSGRKRNIANSAKKEIESMDCQRADYTLHNGKMNEQIDEILKRNNFEDFPSMAEAHQKVSAEKSIYEDRMELLNKDEKTLKELMEERDTIKERLEMSLSRLNLNLSRETMKEINDAFRRKDSVKEQIQYLKNKIDLLDKDIKRFDKEIAFEEKRLEMILNANGAEDVEAFKKAVELHERYEELQKQKEQIQNILRDILANADYYELKSKLINVPEEIKEIDKNEVQLNIFRLNEEKTAMLKSIDEIHNEIEDIEENTRSLAEIEEEISFYENKIGSIKNKVKAAEIAAEKIRQISNSIKGDFMPLLRTTISDNFSYLTGGRYKRVNIDENMNITVMSEEEGDRKIELENLSGGTLDQLYLSLRIALSSILSGNQNIPLILDDSFVQYDATRLRKSLEMLARESERRQVILFTCQEREADLARQMNIPFNYIRL
ncbi:MAG TPA: AAA family ATPase [Sedimentibacter sp.]|nr:AAA family ATPase [Sedimentibacter sp.]